MYSFDISENIICSRFGRVQQKNGWERKTPRKIKENIFVYMISGIASFFLKSSTYEVKQGNILIIPSETEYSAITQDSCEYFFFHFSGKIQECDSTMVVYDIKNNFSFELPECKHDYIFFNLKTTEKTVCDKIYESIILCCEYNLNLSRIKKLLLDTEFTQIMLILGTASEQPLNSLPASVQRIILYIHKNLTQNISLADVCNAVSLSAPYTARLFKKNLNMTVTEYINAQKLYYACELIKNTNMNISEIADYLGYNDLFYFSRLFKKKFGKSPTAYITSNTETTQ